MKKRAQTPDAHTYTIIFKGCAEHKESAQALEKVLAIYHSMSADKCPVKPNTIHVNAVLKMCARAGDLDAMFAIADHLPEKGIRAPNNLTFTTILNGIRQKLLFTRFPEMSAVQSRNESHKLLLVARHIWSDVIKRWRQGDIWIDEELVCAMGRLLLTGDERDADDILSLVRQTMAIPRQFPSRYQSVPAIEGDSEAEPTSTAAAEPDVSQTTPLRNMISKSGSDSGPSEDAIIPFTEVIVPKTTPPQGVAAFPVPGRNTLSLIMAALLNLKTNESAKPYWDILTSPPYSIIPDGPNYADYLRVLRVTRSSKELVSIVTSMPREYRTRGIFRIAMSTCVRDKNNPNSFSNAGKVLDLMQSTITTPDAKILEFYLELALKAPVPSSPSDSSSNTPSSYEEAALLAKRKHGSIIARALQRLAPNLNSLRATLSFGDEETPRLNGVERQQFAEDVERLARIMVSAYDKLMNNGMVDRRMYAPYSKERSKIAAYITRLQSRINAEKKANRQKKAIDARETDMKRLDLTNKVEVEVAQKEEL
jgi:ribosomal protein S17E